MPKTSNDDRNTENIDKARTKADENILPLRMKLDQRNSSKKKNR